MAVRLTRNVSLPAHQNAFVEAMVAGGRYRTASEVVREGLRLLEEAEHRRLLEAWLLEQLQVEGAGEGEPDEMPDGELLERARAQVRAVLEGARVSLLAGSGVAGSGVAGSGVAGSGVAGPGVAGPQVVASA